MMEAELKLTALLNVCLIVSLVLEAELELTTLHNV